MLILTICSSLKVEFVYLLKYFIQEFLLKLFSFNFNFKEGIKTHVLWENVGKEIPEMLKLYTEVQ